MAVKDVLHHWLQRYFSDDEAVIFALLLGGLFAAIIVLGAMLAPFLIALVVAFLLQGVVEILERLHLPRMLAVLLAFSLFVGGLLALIFLLMPLIWQQGVALMQEFPGMIRAAQHVLEELQDRYPMLLSQDQLRQWITAASGELRSVGQTLVTFSLSSIPNLVALMVYLVLVPILVFFMLKDKDTLLGFVSSLMPRRRQLMQRIWQEMDAQIANYIRGKVIEILIVGVATYFGFIVFDLRYAALLALLVGLSVLVPYIGAAVVTIPVLLVAAFQFGLNMDFVWVMVVYGIIQALDGNVLVPLLFSEAVNLHPVSIILAVLFFGGIWGFWGVFFAIPLATLLKSVINAWPRSLSDQDQALQRSDSAV
ncbi:AI-2E family transporter [Terasakiispira papahanaumokuakeensis]|uniref:AI-2E family transporter n=1 Tax=Terasakiispira papahanaumokuakeensis TaxID=197479 RepID=A0A1E2V6I8_9GAMM|nr:AI-2E family transporter [Terasakiispira papahanaumokuakeensis]ODC02597.1 AI-2E family transporter [Terasakiispira papahanaumokuakeensis]